MVTDPRAEYTQRLASWNEVIGRGEQRYNQIANLRGITVALAIVTGFAAVQGTISAWWLGLPVAAFAVLAIVHEGVARRNERARRARRLYERGLARLDGRWAGSGADGGRFLDQDHPYVRDLDLFGPASLFQLLSTAHTEIGEDTLAAWLRQGAALEEIASRQAAVDELRPMIAYREAIAILAPDAPASRTGPLAMFAGTSPTAFSSAARLAFTSLTAIGAVLTLVVLFGPATFSMLIAWVLIQSAIMLRWRRPLHDALVRVDVATEDLKRLKALLERIEAQSFSSARLAALLQQLETDGLRPSQAIARLERLVSVLDSCRNQMFMPIAILFLVRAHATVAIDRWHSIFGSAIGGWLRAVGDLEALSALATYTFEHPGDVFPELVAGETMFDAEALAHPLLAESAAVRNDVRLGGRHPRVLIVSGSNMSGKSTLLRAVGVNVVLALAGAPVRASRLRLSRVALGATLRIEDSLQEGHSKFYAEILRLRAIVEIARGPIPLLFLLDEILGGTNSHDCRLGAEAVVAALVQAGAIGLVTTHDLALTEMAGSLGAAAANVHFEDRLEEGRLLFDYRMRSGVVERGNALALMRAVGLLAPVSPDSSRP